MQEKLDRIENKIDAVIEAADLVKGRLASIDTTLAVNTASLVEHMRRTAVLETKLEPIEKHVYMVNGALKFIGIIGVVAAIAEGVAAVMGFLRS